MRISDWSSDVCSSDLRDAVAAVHVAGGAGDVERLAAIVALDQRDRLGGGDVLVEHPADPQRRLEAERDLGLHVGELLLDELRRRQRPAESLAVAQIGREACRERGCQSVWISVAAVSLK